MQRICDHLKSWTCKLTDRLLFITEVAKCLAFMNKEDTQPIRAQYLAMWAFRGLYRCTHRPTIVFKLNIYIFLLWLTKKYTSTDLPTKFVLDSDVTARKQVGLITSGVIEPVFWPFGYFVRFLPIGWLRRDMWNPHSAPWEALPDPHPDDPKRWHQREHGTPHPFLC